MHTLIGPFINLMILVGIMAYYLRQPMKDFARNRAESIREQVARARDLLERAKARHAEFSSKLKAMDAEISGLKTQAMQDAQAMKSRIVAEAQKLSADISTDAHTAVVTLYSEFKGQIYGELGSRVLDRAEEILRERLTGDDQARIRMEFSHQIEGTPMIETPSEVVS